MSFDELPPGSTPPHTGEDEASSAAQEPSGQDAPPVGVSRRRRAKTAGTAAASSPVPAEEPAPDKPARPARTRRTKELLSSSEAVGLEPDATIPAVPLVETVPTEAAKQAEAPRRSRGSRRVAAATEVITPSAPEAEINSALPVTPVPTNAEVSPPAGRRRRSAKPLLSSVSPEITPELTHESAAEPGSPAPAPVRRSRTKRTRADITPAPPADELVAPLDPLEAIQPGTDAPEARPTRRRLRTRGVRAAAPEPMPEPDATDVEDGESAQEDQGAAVAGRTRRRRSRRSTTRGESDAPSEERAKEKPGQPADDIYVAPNIDRTVGSHLISRNGMPEIHINGRVYPPVLFFGNMEDDQNRDKVVAQVRWAASAGVHIHSTIIELPCPVSEISPAFAVAGERLQTLLDADPEGYIMPRVVFVPARGWKRQNPSEVASYTEGTPGDPSIASDRYWREAEHSLQLLVTYVSNQEWANRVAGYHLERGEWFQPMSLGYDRSPANRDAFREWLKHKYNNNVILLRAAWYNGEVQFQTAEIPPLAGKPNPQRAFYEARRERATIDFHEFSSEVTARRLVALATATKRAAEHKALVSVCYGYTFEFGHTFSGHLALGLLESSQAIDLICGPPSYRDRGPGGAASFPAPIDSPPLHGKLWLSEDDTKTFLASALQDPEDFNIRLESRQATDQAQQRALGRTQSHTTGIGFMDLWGEGWLDDDTLWQQVAVFVSRYAEQLRKKEHPRVPEVVALIDEKSLLHVQRGEQFLRRITAGMRDSLQRAGVSFGAYLQSDLLSDSFPLEAKLYLFLTPYRLTAEQRIAVKEKLQRDGKTLAWIYAPGSCEERPSVGGALEETATGVIGIALRQQEWNSEVGSRVVDSHHAVTDRLLGRDIGVKERLNPSFYVDDPDATVLAEYHGTGLPSIAVKNCGTWKSVFVGDPALPIDLLRGICRFAGVHVWTPLGEDIIDIGNGFVTIHAVKDGQRTIRLPDATGLYDVTENRHVADEIREHRFFMHGGDTRSFCVGSAERFIGIGLPNVAPPGLGRQRTITAAVHAPEKEREREPRRDRDKDKEKEPTLQKPRNSDLETLEAVLNMDISDLQGVDLEALPDEPIDFIYADTALDVVPGVLDATGEVVAGGRRRRRRGGRGRGRRRAGDTADEITPAGTSEAGANDSSAPQGNVEPANADFTNVRNSSSEKNVWASESENEMEIPHADPGPSLTPSHGNEGDASL